MTIGIIISERNHRFMTSTRSRKMRDSGQKIVKEILLCFLSFDFLLLMLCDLRVFSFLKLLRITIWTTVLARAIIRHVELKQIPARDS